jgi:hypothetical protein
VTAAGIHSAPRGTAPAEAAYPPVVAAFRLAWLHAVSRRIPAALGLIAALGVLLWIALHYRWNIAGGHAAQMFISLTIEAGAAAVIAVATYGPFGEPERATGRWLPYLRLAAAAALTAAAFGALAAGATGGNLPGGQATGGALALLRNVAGMTGLGLLAAVLLGGMLAWVGPMAYLLVTEVALQGPIPTTPWVWPARPPDDLGAALCAAGVFAAGVVLISLRGARESLRD